MIDFGGLPRKPKRHSFRNGLHVFSGDPFGVPNPSPRCLLACGCGIGAAFAAEAVGWAGGIRNRPAALMIALLSSAAAAQAQTCPDPPPDPAAAWSAGFAMYVGRFCPGWRADLAAMHDARALPGLAPACFQTQFAPDSPAALSLRQGGEAAEAAHAADPAFCADPARSPLARALVRTFIAPRP